MATYLTVSFNHFLAIQKWAAEAGASALLDFKDFTLEVKHRGRYYRMHPMFQARANGRLMHVSSLSESVRGFGGWRPYQTFTHPHSTDKALFKRFLEERGLRSPSTWQANETPSLDYVLKAGRGSFGESVYGPFRANTLAALSGEGVDEAKASANDLFAEQFIRGRMLKVWFWGRRPFFAHVHEYPTVVGDGERTIETLMRRRLIQAQLDWDSHADPHIARACLALQGLELQSIPLAGQSVWIDFRYGDRYPARVGGTPVSDNALEELQHSAGEQVDAMGWALTELLQPTIPVPVIITVDGVLDADGRIWWLEMNTNSVLPPEGYAAMFEDLFA